MECEVGRPVYSTMRRGEAIAQSAAIFIGRIADAEQHIRPGVQAIAVLDVIKQCELRPLSTGVVISVGHGGYDKATRLSAAQAATGRTVSYPAVRYETPIRLLPTEVMPHVFFVALSEAIDFELVADGSIEVLEMAEDIRLRVSELKK